MRWDSYLVASVLLFGTSSILANGSQRNEHAGEGRAAATPPTIAGVYAVDSVSTRGSRVTFTQYGDSLLAKWLGPDGSVYARGKYLWEPASNSFGGFTVLQTFCTGGADQLTIKPIEIIVREQMYAVANQQLRIRWTKPLSIDCDTGEFRFFRWSEALWTQPDAPRDSRPE